MLIFFQDAGRIQIFVVASSHFPPFCDKDIHVIGSSKRYRVQKKGCRRSSPPK